MRRFIPFLIFLCTLIAADMMAVDGAAGTTDAAPEPGPARGPEWYFDQASEAADQEFYDKAVRLFKEGQERYPLDIPLRAGLGDLYTDQHLFALALDEYRAAEKIDHEDYEVLYRLGETLGYLTRDSEAAEVFERLNRLYPDDSYVLADLGWLYFKSYRLEEGVDLLERAVEKLGPDRILIHTLATLYSGLYSYDKAKELYLSAAAEALATGRIQFAAIAYYNLSLLERAFYRFGDGMEYARKSLDLADRAPGHLSLGELYQRRLDFTEAEREYGKALQQDTSPLTRLNLADLSLDMGRPRKSLEFLRSAEREEDGSWMYNFGTDRDRHRMDLENLYADVYKALAFRERLRGDTPWERLAALFRGAGYRIRSWYHRERFRDLSMRVGRAQLREGNLLDGYWSLFSGSEGYARTEKAYLDKARDIELSLAPASLPYYQVEEGRIGKDPDLILRGMAGFDPVWEGWAIADACRKAAPLLLREKRWAEYYDVCYRLRSLHPQAFLLDGIPVPALLTGSVPAGMKRALKRSGFFFPGNARESIPFEISGVRTGGKLRISVIDRRESRSLGSISMERRIFSAGYSGGVRDLMKKMYIIDIEQTEP